MTGINKRSNQPAKGLQKKVSVDAKYGSFGIIKKINDMFSGMAPADKKKKKK